MNITIGSRWKELIAEAMETGRYASEEDVISEGLRLVAEKERQLRALRVLIEDSFSEAGGDTVDDVIAAVEAALAPFEAGAGAR